MAPKPIRAARKAGVAVVGGSLVGVGIILIPLPGPGSLVILAGLGVLATEFPAARRTLDGAKARVSDAIDRMRQDDEAD